MLFVLALEVNIILKHSSNTNRLHPLLPPYSSPSNHFLTHLRAKPYTSFSMILPLDYNNFGWSAGIWSGKCWHVPLRRTSHTQKIKKAALGARGSSIYVQFHMELEPPPKLLGGLKFEWYQWSRVWIQSNWKVAPLVTSEEVWVSIKLSWIKLAAYDCRTVGCDIRICL